MAGIDGLLRMLLTNGGDELRVGTDSAPKMARRGAPLRLSIPPTDDATLRHLLDGMLTSEREEALRASGRVELEHALGEQRFAVALQTRPGGFEATFTVGAQRKPSAPVVPIAPAPVASPIAPVARPISQPSSRHELLERVVRLGASDLHLQAGAPPMVRIDGRLRALEDGDGERQLSELIDATAQAELDAGRSVDRALELDGIGRFRVHLYRADERPAAAIRVLPRRAPRLSELGLPVPLEELVQAPHGLVLVVGPTGAGKSATLAALAEEALARRGGLLITLEDPIEYRFDERAGALVRQRQIGRDVRDFAGGLRDALREDPDLILVGEMRDPESIALALTAAETGHLVLASLHSRSAAATIERIVDSSPPERQQQIRVQLADALRAVVAQRLLPCLRGGRVPAVEILRANHTVGSLIREGKSAQLPSVLQSSRKEGMLPLERCLAELVRSGQISRETAVAAANDPISLTTYMHH